MKVALHSVLKEGQESNYGEAHATVPLDLASSLLAAGIRDWSKYLAKWSTAFSPCRLRRPP